MMKKAKKFFGVSLAMMLASSCLLVGCGGGGGDKDGGVNIEGADADAANKTVIVVNNYAGGFGKDWIISAAERFEQYAKEMSFEEGKTGVDVRYYNNKDQGETYLGNLAADPCDVFFPGNIYYHNWVDANEMLKITDVVEGINSDGKTILSKMTDEEKEFYKVNNEYYAIPHHNSIPGIVYDVDLFENQALYFAKDGAPSEAGYDSNVGAIYSSPLDLEDGETLSAGPDGQYGTYDDGLPATYEDFFVLCEEMISPARNIIPMTWIGANKAQYTNMMMTALMVDYEGAEQTKINFTYDGVAKNLIEVAADGTITELPDTTITEENGYMVYHNAGRYYALKFFEQLRNNANYLDAGTRDGYDLEKTHRTYLRSTDRTPIAFMSEGNWWENESTGLFKTFATNYGDYHAKENRRFGFLPLPKATADKVGEGMTYTVSEVSLGFIKASIDSNKIKAAKAFLQFCYTDGSLNDYTKITNLPAALSYEIDAEIYNGMSYFGKQQVAIHKDTANLVKPYSRSSIYNTKNGELNLEYTFRTGTGEDPIATFEGGRSAISHFRTLCNSRFSKTAWYK